MVCWLGFLRNEINLIKGPYKLFDLTEYLFIGNFMEGLLSLCLFSNPYILGMDKKL